MIDQALIYLWVSLGLTMVFFIAILCAWTYSYLSKRSDARVIETLNNLFSDYMDTHNVKQQQAKDQIGQYIQRGSRRKELFIKLLIQHRDEHREEHDEQLILLIQQTKIHGYLEKMLLSKSVYKQALACRYAGDINIQSLRDLVYKLIKSESNVVVYHVLLALSKLGDLNRLSESLYANANNINLSFRAVVEVLSVFTGSKEELFKATIEHSDNYIKGVLIKMAVDQQCEGLMDYYIQFLSSTDKNLKIACVRAIAQCEGEANEQQLIDCLDDEMWEVRAAAAKGLENIGTKKSFESLSRGVSDKEWWVRQNAAVALVSIPGGMDYAKKIIDGKDRYASEAILGVLAKTS
ncbi:MAG: HEAT repeat domain-containing protein [Candidatus Cohnella colombiensis]|uniref:HEAT repeat domain-containing protein n=1 Tax=Candidatus Cohnella colombiensis TaxID=3121368 RepID=A0AA95EZ63_9BACL|nr:MAG: HEAT repeat domain-containing protein [Cohnella sp.]